MKIIVTGGAGFLGSRVIEALLATAETGRPPLPFDTVVSVDLVPCTVPDPRVVSRMGNLTDRNFTDGLFDDEVAAVFHLAAVLSGGSAQDFDLAQSVNLDGTRNLLESARATGSAPPFVFTSSLAVFGGEVPPTVGDTWAEHPDSTYGAFKAIGELLVNEYSRKGFVDARICRLPTIAIRPGRPNSAASSFASGIIREPLNGQVSICPVPPETRLWLSSPDAAVANLVHALGIPSEDLPAWRALNLPGISVTVQEMLDALLRVGGEAARSRVRLAPDPAVMEIVCSWPGNFDTTQALGLGFVQDTDIDEVVRQYKDQYLP